MQTMFHFRRYWLLIASVILILVLSLLLIFTTGETHTSSHCRICDGLPFHAPCLIDLSTGDILELSVYDNDPVWQGKLSDTQSTGHFSLTMSGGMVAAKDAGVSCQTSISLESRLMNTALFCNSCQDALNNIPNTGIVLADLYDLESIRYYVIKGGAEYSIRDYAVNINQELNSELRIIVTGSI